MPKLKDKDGDGQPRRALPQHMDDMPDTADVLLDAVLQLLGNPGYQPDIQGWFIMNPKGPKGHFKARILGPDTKITHRIIAQIVERAPVQGCVVLEQTSVSVLLTRKPY